VTSAANGLTGSPSRGTLVPAAVPSKGVKMQGLRVFWSDDQGQGMVEYALIIAVIALAILITQVFFSGQIKNFFSNIGNTLT
jgi:pilus assembly protein Flp/PilA